LMPGARLGPGVPIGKVPPVPVIRPPAKEFEFGPVGVYGINPPGKELNSLSTSFSY